MSVIYRCKSYPKYHFYASEALVDEREAFNFVKRARYPTVAPFQSNPITTRFAYWRNAYVGINGIVKTYL